MVSVTTVAGRATLYRVGRADTSQGLWYDTEGRYAGLIHRLAHGPAAELPMGEHPVFRAEGRRWISVTESLETLRDWFSRRDMEELLPYGYEVQAIEVTEHRVLAFPTYSHEAYSADHALAKRTVDPELFYPGIGIGRA
jgi:hypothetical protein